MAAHYAQLTTSFEELIATRALARFYAWIVAGLVILYVVTFPVLQSAIMVSVPVAVAGWFYYRRGGILAAILAIPLNVYLIDRFVGDLSWSTIFNLQTGFLIGHIFAAVASIMIGYLREVFENIFRLNQRLRSQERFLALSNMMVKKILSPDRPGKLFDDIVIHLTNLFVADYGYISRWDHVREKAFLIAATKPIESNGDGTLNVGMNADETAITKNVLQTGQALFIEDITTAPSPSNSVNIAATQHARSAICLPLVAREYKFGTAILTYEAPRRYTDEDKAFAEQVGYQIAMALWTVRQDELSLNQLNETQTLMQIGQALGRMEQVGLDVVLQLIVDSAKKLIPQAEKTIIHLVDADGKALVPQAISGFYRDEKTIPHLRMHIGSGAAGQVLRDGITINIADVHDDPRFLQSRVKPAYSSLLVAPVQTSGKRLGTISVESTDTHAFSEHEAELLQALGTQAAIAIENTRLFESTQQSLKEVNALYKISQSLTSSLEADQPIQDVVTLLQQYFGYYHVDIFLLEPISGDLVFKRGSGETGARFLEQGLRLPRGTGIIGHVAETGIPFVTDNVNEVVFFYRDPRLPNTQSELAVPIKVDGRVVGVLDIQHEPPHRLTDRDLQLMTAVADQLAVTLQRASLYTNLQKALQQEQTIRSQLLQNERLALVGRLLASVSHELNNPLQAIQNALFLLKEEANLSPQGNQDLGIILSETERMAALIERLRSAYRPVRIKDFQPVQVNNLVEDIYALIATHMRHKQIAFEFIPDPELPVISGIADQIRQVVLNLFFNAIEIMKPGGCLTVQTQGLPSQKEILLSVRDTGPGIDVEILPNIFEPFVTSKSTGTGLGLTITHDIIHQHHGRIQAENYPDGGALFSVWLPIDERESS
ncbi:MAG TPA: GAF domain-containing protein [Anaerolineales bacterium]|nr:GAF domain-containing protein [Anaerolineales bacterium]